MTDARVVAIDAIVLRTAAVGPLVGFYVDALGFSIESETADVAVLRLGDQTLVLRCSGKGAPYPELRAANDPWFQHFAIVVSDMPAAYARLNLFGQSPISRSGPQQLPASTGGVIAYKFRDPEGHPLELSFIPGAESWNAAAKADPGALFLGIDHTALAVSDLDASIAFYRALGFSEGPRFLNQGPEQDRLDGLDAVVLDIGTLTLPGGGPHIELLHYRSPSPPARRPIATDDLAATATKLRLTPGARAPGKWSDPDGHLLMAAPS